MNKFFVLLAPLLLVACQTDGTTAGVTAVAVPPLPAELSIKAERLPDITDNSMGGLIRDADATDKQYNSVAHQNNNLIDFYNCVRDSINNSKPLDKCLGVEDESE